jgi:hypothetical protein
MMGSISSATVGIDDMLEQKMLLEKSYGWSLDDLEEISGGVNDSNPTRTRLAWRA